jgi:exportin-1
MILKHIVGVQDMACDTFIKIAQKCRRHFVIQQPQELMPYIEEILANLESITSDLQPQQVHTFYEAVGYMISAQPNKQQQERLIMKLMSLPNGAWDTIMTQARHSGDVLNNPDNVKILANILKTNVAACSSIGSPFIAQIGRIYMDLLSLYKAVSELISGSVVSQGNSSRYDTMGYGFMYPFSRTCCYQDSSCAWNENHQARDSQTD